jgi:two-component sensor histidine kinase
MTTAARLFRKVDGEHSFAQAVVETVREPLLVLDGDLNILHASGSFHRAFQIGPDKATGRKIFALDGDAWDFPGLRALLGPALSRHDAVTGFKVTHRFPWIGERTLLLHAHKTPSEEVGGTIILLAFEDVTEQRATERERERLQRQTEELVLQKEMLLREMQHRVLNSLQIIASILMLKARAVSSEEARQHLLDAHQRVMAVAAVQQHLHSYGPDDPIAIGSYLQNLCTSLAGSMIGDECFARIQVLTDESKVRSGDAVNLGLIVTELVINALKYAFPDPGKSAVVTVRYEIGDPGWRLSVCDNGTGRNMDSRPAGKGGLGTALVRALARQMGARVEADSSSEGFHVFIIHASFVAGAASTK